MAIERGYIDFTVYRGDKELYACTFFDSPDGVDPTAPINQTPVDILARYDEIIMDIRASDDQTSKLIFSLKLSEGGFIVSNTNNLSFELTNTQAAGLFYYDIRFKFLGVDEWETLVSGTVNNIANISKL